MKTVFALAACALAAVAASGAAAGKGGPAPGVTIGWNGVLAADGKTRYVALPNGSATTVAAIRARTGTVLRFATVRGTFGVPLVAYDGSTAGLSHDGRVLVLASATPAAARGAVSRFAVVATKTLRLRELVALPGTWSLDALSPDGRMLYLVQYLNEALVPSYRVRAYDLERDVLVPRAVVDPRARGEAMAGQSVTRANGPGGGWAYTLYRKPGAFPFVHALDTVNAKAICIELPWRRGQEALWGVRMRVSPDGNLLSLRKAGKPLAAIDLRTLEVTPFRKPAV